MYFEETVFEERVLNWLKCLIEKSLILKLKERKINKWINKNKNVFINSFR